MMENAKPAFPTFPPHGGGWMFAIRIMINPFGSIESMGVGRPSLTIESDQRVMTKVPALYPPLAIHAVLKHRAGDPCP